MRRAWFAALVLQASLALPGPARAEDGPTLTIAVGGDVMFGRVTADGYRAHAAPAGLGDFGATLRRADVAMVNLETGICRQGRAASVFPLLWAPAGRLDTLAQAGVDAVSVANNHALDCGPDGVAHTLAALRDRGIAAAGIGPDGAVEVGEHLLVVAATLHRPPYRCMAPCVRVATRDGDELVASVAALRAAHPRRLLLVSLHWGKEGAHRPAAWQTALGRRLVEAGANAVVGHGPHVAQPPELHRGAPILYSLGNLLFDPSLAERRPVPPAVLRFRREGNAWRLTPARAAGSAVVE